MISLQQAQRELQQAAAMNPGPWIAHSQSVAENARLIAQRAGMDEQRAYLFGLLHDIGRRAGITGIRHIFDGYDYMTALGQPEVARICLTHSFQIQRMDAYIGRRDIPPQALNELEQALKAAVYDDYDRLIQLCDSIAGTDGPVDMAARMEDVRRRYGSYPQDKWDRNFELKGYFEHWAGAGLYQIVGAPRPL